MSSSSSFKEQVKQVLEKAHHERRQKVNFLIHKTLDTIKQSILNKAEKEIPQMKGHQLTVQHTLLLPDLLVLEMFKNEFPKRCAEHDIIITFTGGESVFDDDRFNMGETTYSLAIQANVSVV